MEVKERRFFVGRILMSLIISAIIFAIFFLISNVVVYHNLKNSERESSTIQERLEKIVNEKDICNLEYFIEISKLLQEEGTRISFLETKLGKNDERVLRQKKRYSQLEIIHYLLIENMNERCNSSLIPIFFFYSNDPSQLDESEIKGFVLEKFKKKSRGQIMVYSFDINLKMEEIEELLDEYNVTKVSVFIGDTKEEIFFESLKELEEMNILEYR